MGSARYPGAQTILNECSHDTAALTLVSHRGVNVAVQSYTATSTSWFSCTPRHECRGATLNNDSTVTPPDLRTRATGYALQLPDIIRGAQLCTHQPRNPVRTLQAPCRANPAISRARPFGPPRALEMVAPTRGSGKRGAPGRSALRPRVTTQYNDVLRPCKYPRVCQRWPAPIAWIEPSCAQYTSCTPAETRVHPDSREHRGPSKCERSIPIRDPNHWVAHCRSPTIRATRSFPKAAHRVSTRLTSCGHLQGVANRTSRTPSQRYVDRRSNRLVPTKRQPHHILRRISCPAFH